jgi:signal transduction histidine kinase
MSPEQVEKIFNRFYRAENKAGDSTRGYGLGLALVRRLSRLLGIRVALESDTGSGTKFMLEIPRHSPEP